MDDLDFLEQASTADSSAVATLMVLLPDGSVIQIPDINTFIVLDKCPLLYHAFEFREYGDAQQASVEATSRAAIVSLLRFLYTGSYLVDQDECLGALLPHAEAFKIADDFDVPELQVQAYVNFTQDTEMSCCNGTTPSDLCATIQFLYRHLASKQSQEHHSLLDTLLNYCTSVFTYQALGKREDFRQIVFDNPAFHQDLCKTNMKKDFEDEGASEIMKLPVCRPTPHSQAVLLKRALGDFQYEIWQEGGEPILETGYSDSSPSPTKKRRSSHGAFALVHRPKHADGVPNYSSGESESESSSDEHVLVHRPKHADGVPTYASGESESESSSDEFVLVHRPKHTRPVVAAAGSESEPEGSSDEQGFELVHNDLGTVNGTDIARGPMKIPAPIEDACHSS